MEGLCDALAKQGLESTGRQTPLAEGMLLQSPRGDGHSSVAHLSSAEARVRLHIHGMVFVRAGRCVFLGGEKG